MLGLRRLGQKGVRAMPVSRSLAFAKVLAFDLVALSILATASRAFTTPNSDGTYQQLRNISVSGGAIGVNDLTLKREAGTFRFRSGTLCFLAPVQGKVTGAVFLGEGTFVLEPPLAGERNNLRLLTKDSEFVEKFDEVVLRFTDSTFEELKKNGSAASGSCSNDPLQESQKTMRKKLHYNLDGRILEDILSPSPGGLFVAFIHGQHYSGHEIFAIDPQGAPPLIMSVSPEEVEFVTYDDSKLGVWTSFHLAGEYKTGAARGSQVNAAIHIEHQTLDTTIEKNANVVGKATTSIVAQVNGLSVVPFNLFPTLRVQSVTTEKGESLNFIQEDKKDDSDFFVLLPKPLNAGEKINLITTYSGKDAVVDTGNGNYYPVARDNWYPSSPNSSFGDFSTYDLTFHIPKGLKMAATGSLVSEREEGGQSVSIWKSETLQPAAGFQFGRMKEQEVKLNSPEVVVSVFANEEPPDWAIHLRGGTMGNLSTVSMMKQPLAEAQVAMALYTAYFGALPFKRLAMTQQTACTYGQSWPELVWLPICSFYDGTVRHQLGLDRADRGYWKVVAPHEVAHQWWGHTVGFNSYRDQWMSEGFADFSASLFLQAAYGDKGMKEFHTFWDDERKSLIEKNAMGFRAVDVGPVTMGYRLSNSRVGFNVTRELIYPKGAYILHMIRMMMWDRSTGDDNFKAMMQDFVKTYSGKTASTEDFKGILEKHMNGDMKRAGKGSMDWFFDDYVYGTQIPSYQFTSSFDNDAENNIVLSIKLTQSNVDDHFRMLVPLYLEMADGHMMLLGRANLAGNQTMEQKIPLKGLKDKPRRALINYMDDVLASN